MSDVTTDSSRAEAEANDFDAVIIGAGFSGVYALIKARELGLRARVFEAGDGVGGTWYWNRYPEARCDIQIMDYSYSFSDELQRKWSWSERFAAQPEILSYINFVADEFDLRRDIQLSTKVIGAEYDEVGGTWTIETDQGQTVVAQFVILATGPLSVPRIPDIEGLDRFKGQWYHTAEWPHDGVDFAGKRVGIIGTGSSGVQMVPPVSKSADQLYVFQRTPCFSVPSRNRPLTEDDRIEMKESHAEHRRLARLTKSADLRYPSAFSADEVTPEERERELERRWEIGGTGFTAAFRDTMINPESNAAVADYVRRKIHEVVKDPEVADLLTPKEVPIGAKRLCVDNGYYESFNRDNVTLVDVKSDPIVEITETGVRTAFGEYDVDIIVFATGFDAMTGAALRINPVGRGDVDLTEKWGDGPRTYLGLMTAGFPNLFVVASVGSPSVLATMLSVIEQHIDWITDCISYMRGAGFNVIEPTDEAEDRWVTELNQAAAGTLYPSANSWYLGANVPGKPRVFMPYIKGFDAYSAACQNVAESGYAGFEFK